MESHGMGCKVPAFVHMEWRCRVSVKDIPTIIDLGPLGDRFTIMGLAADNVGSEHTHGMVLPYPGDDRFGVAMMAAYRVTCDADVKDNVVFEIRRMCKCREAGVVMGKAGLCSPRSLPCLTEQHCLGVYDGDQSHLCWRIPYCELHGNMYGCGHIIISLAATVARKARPGLQNCIGDLTIPALPPHCDYCKLSTDFMHPDPVLTAPPTLRSPPDYVPAENQPEPIIPYVPDCANPFAYDRHCAPFGVRVGKQEFYVCPAVVAAKSSVFRGYFTNEVCAEYQQGFVDVCEISGGYPINPADMRRMLDAIYDHRVVGGWEMSFDSLIGIYYLADRFDVPTVMYLVRKMLRHAHIDASNLCDVLHFADTCNLEEVVQRSCFCAVQKALPRNFWDIEPGSTFVTHHECKDAFRKYSECIKATCCCGPPLNVEDEG